MLPSSAETHIDTQELDVKSSPDKCHVSENWSRDISSTKSLVSPINSKRDKVEFHESIQNPDISTEYEFVDIPLGTGI